MKVRIVNGLEGPEHDPYGYKEIIVARHGHTAVAHFGLALWYTVDGLISDEAGFAKAVRLLPDEAEDAFIKWLASCRLCGNKHLYPVDDYPGETLYICRRCDGEGNVL